MNKKLWVAILVAGLIVVLAGGAWYVKWRSQKPEVVTIGLVDGGAEALAFQIIKDNGWDLQDGLDLQIVKEQSPGDIERQLQSSQLFIGVFSPIAAVQDDEKGSDLRIIAPIFRNITALIVPANSPYQSVNDLVGKKIGVLPRFTTLFNELQLVFEKVYHISPDKDFEITFANDFQGQVDLLKSRNVDGLFAIPTESIILSEIIAEGRIVDTMNAIWERNTGHSMPFSSIVAHDSWIQTHQKETLEIRALMYRALALVKSDPSILSRYSTLLGIQTPQEMAIMQKDFIDSLYTDDGPQTQGDLLYLLDQAKAVGMVQSIPPSIIVK